MLLVSQIKVEETKSWLKEFLKNCWCVKALRLSLKKKQLYMVQNLLIKLKTMLAILPPTKIYIPTTVVYH